MAARERHEIDRQILERIERFRRSDDDVPDSWRARREVASAVRALLDVLSTTDAAADVMRSSAKSIRALAEHFAAHPAVIEPRGIAEMAFAGMEDFHDRSPLVGRSNPLAPPLALFPDPDKGIIEGTTIFGNAYEGAPGCVHGGFIAAAFDELLGMACIFSGSPGMTGTLEVTYRTPTPTRTPLRFEGRFEGREGRRIQTRGEMWAGERLCAEASGLFISIDRSKFEQLSRIRRERSGADATDTPHKNDADG
ncbi:MAG: PaaI family thioesterase [Deltaproteobacteria bacterium]|jgi:acyl-coenzyme A thioesterase PaaI-like protein|nr:PaaI family thioesterase [Deltaproteobacteria bacterium]